MTSSWLSRLWRQWRSAVGSAGCPVVYAQEYGLDLPTTAIDPKRAARILGFLHSEKLLSRGDLRQPRAAPLSRLLEVHSEPYLDSLQDPEASTALLGVSLTESRLDEFLSAHRFAVGGTILASELALARSSVAINLSGGFHHAHRDAGHGFCVFNDVAVAIAERRSRGYDGPVLVVDLDLHDGDGTRILFRQDDSVFTFSIHNQDLTSTEARASFSLPLGAEVGDGPYLTALRKHLPPVIESVRPGLVFYLAGCDPAIDDPLGNWRVTAAGLLERDRFVMDTLGSYDANLPIVILLAGGYGGKSWRYSARFFASMLRGGDPVEPPLSAELLLTEYRTLSRLLRESDLRIDVGEDWALSSDDLPGAKGAWATPRNRFLGYYSRHGFELALERYGILDRMRSRGFEDLYVDFDLDNPAGQTVQVRTGEFPRSTLMELRVRRDTRAVEGMELLAVEWLLLQDPASRFRPGRVPLPGQKHPGLGLLTEVAAFLVMVCERIGLDGLEFTPSHYHLAVQSRRLLSFLDPVQDGRFRVLQRALSGLRLMEAAKAIETGHVIDAMDDRPVTWTPAPMVLPVSDRLKARLGDERYRARAEEAESMADFRLSTELS